MGYTPITGSKLTRRILLVNNVFEDVSGAAWGERGALPDNYQRTVEHHPDHNTVFTPATS